MNPTEKSKSRQILNAKTWRWAFYCTCVFIFAFFANCTKLDASTPPAPKDNKGTGAKEITEEQIQKIQETWPRIIWVRPNKLGLSRIERHLQASGSELDASIMASLPEDEFITAIGSSEETLEFSAAAALPSSVNNSILPSYPPIGNQQQEGSCVGFATTYYQASHEIGMLNGYNNKTSQTHVLSPRWTYNLLNGGADGGLYPADAYSLLQQNGAPSIVSFPYINGDYKSWDLNTQDWISAMSNRTTPVQYITGIGGATQNLQTIKQLLTNGHVIPFGTWAHSWVFTKIKADPANPNSPYVGQRACTYQNGRNGSHFITIVGYDDNIWIDVNENGQVDSGERGAFLVSNSWGTGWGNKGFMWISYDAFLNVSAVPNGPSSGRLAMASTQNNYVFACIPKSANYSPKLIGEFTLSQAYRNQISIVAGISTPSQTSPASTFPCTALMNKGGPWAFNGSSPTQDTATFAVDLTDLLATNTNTERYYLVTKDNVRGNPTILSKFSLLDLKNNKQVDYSGNLPLTCDNSQVTPYIDYTFGRDTQPPTVSITSPLNNATVQGTVNATVSATDANGIANVQMYVDSTLIASDRSSPYQFSWDSTRFSNGKHVLTAIATDTFGNAAQISTTVNINNASSYSLCINCGGSEVMYGGLDYKNDMGYSGASNVYTNNSIQYANSIYNSGRYGGKDFDYTFPVSNGNYSVTLKFSENYFQAPNKRIFSVSLNGSQVISNLDIFKQVGYGKPYDLTFPITVTNSSINIMLIDSIDWAIISGIAIQSR